jgi:demethylmenaquinone methyltransferase/2-methoxy-6-polyprenyl-1,4-benzoquinol methylase
MTRGTPGAEQGASAAPATSAAHGRGADDSPTNKTPSRIGGMFDAIAPRYDLLNHLLSLGLDRRWRDRAIDALALPAGSRVLDLCTGTGDLAIAAVRRADGASVIGVDFAGEMIRRAAVKIRAGGWSRSIRLIRGDAAQIPLNGGCCDAATIGFGIRNVAEPHRALAELSRVLRRGGRLAILEFGQPKIPGIRTLYAWYFRYLLPLIGRAVSKHNSAYSYLPASVGLFPPPAEFARLITASGFSQVRAVSLTFGIVYLYTGEKT